MSYSPKTIANYFINSAYSYKNSNINCLKLIKLIYFAHGWTLALTNTCLINEPIIGYKYGIKMNFIDSMYKEYGNEKISKYLDQDYQELYDFNKDKKIKLILKEVFETYKDFNNNEIIHLIIKKGSPWDLSFKKRNILIKCLKRKVIIPTSIIRTYFQDKLNDKKSVYEFC